MKQVTRQTLSIFARHVKPRRGLFLCIVLAVAAGAVIDMIIPLYYKRFFDVLAGATGARDAAADTLLGILGSIVVLYVTSWVFWRIAGFTNNYFQPRVLADLTSTCFDRLHRHAYSFFVNSFVGSLVRRVNRFADAFEGLADKFYWDLFPLALRLGVILFILFREIPLIAWILLGWSILFLSVNYAFTLYKLRYDEELASLDSVVTGQLADSITNNTNIKLFSALREEYARFREYIERQFRLRKFTWDLNATMDAIQAGLIVTAEFLLFYFAIKFWRTGQITVGHFVLIQIYFLELIIRLWDFGRIIRDVYKHFANAEEMTAILMTPPMIADRPHARRLRVTGGALAYRDVVFSYLAGRSVFNRFSLDIPPAQRVGLVGPSGGGKSSLVALLFRFYDVQGGGIYIDGQDIRHVSQDSLRAAVSLVPQDPILFHRSLMENIRYGRRTATDREVMRAARLAHCDEFIDRLPEKYDTFVGERGIKLSGGERQRVAIARAILKDAPILVLDEATSSLDSHSEALIQDALEKLMQGKTTVVIAHRLSTIMKMDRIVVIRNGTIDEEGTHTALVKRRSGLYKKLWELQAGGFIAP